MTTTPISVDLAQHDTHPILTWTLMREDGVTPQDLTPAGRSVELWYWDAEHAGRTARALWKVTLTKFPAPATPTEKAKVIFTASATERFYPTALETRGLGTRSLIGWLRYLDSASSPATAKWIKAALLVTADEAPVAP